MSIVSSSASTPGSGDRVALDTSVAIDVLAAKADVRLLSSVREHLLPVPVVGELRYGALNSRKAAENLAKVEALITRCVVLNVTVDTRSSRARVVHAAGQGIDDWQPRARPGRGGAQPLGERLSFDDFEYECADITVMLDAVNGFDVGMVKRRQ